MPRVTWIVAVSLLIASLTPVVALDGASELSRLVDDVVSLLTEKSPRLSILKSVSQVLEKEGTPSKADWERVARESRTVLQSSMIETGSIAARFGLWMARYAPNVEDEDNIALVKSLGTLIATVRAQELQRAISEIQLIAACHLITLGIQGDTKGLKDSFDGCCNLIRLICADLWGDTNTGKERADLNCKLLGLACLGPIQACSLWNPTIDLDEYERILGTKDMPKSKTPRVRL